MMSNRLMVLQSTVVIVVVVAVAVTQLLLLDALLQMNFCVSFLLIGSRKLTTTGVAAKRLFAGMRANVSRQMIGARE